MFKNGYNWNIYVEFSTSYNFCVDQGQRAWMFIFIPRLGRPSCWVPGGHYQVSQGIYPKKVSQGIKNLHEECCVGVGHRNVFLFKVLCSCVVLRVTIVSLYFECLWILYETFLGIEYLLYFLIEFNLFGFFFFLKSYERYIFY